MYPRLEQGVLNGENFPVKIWKSRWDFVFLRRNFTTHLK